MLLTRTLPNKLNAFDKTFEIITNARFWISVTVEYENLDGNFEAQMDLLLGCIKDKDYFYNLSDKYKKRLLERIHWFFNCDIFRSNDNKREHEKEETEKLYDFERDGGDITAAFQAAYKIDLTTELDSMHWWRFMALFNYLPEDTHFVSYKLHYRRLKKTDYEYRNASDDMKIIIDRVKESVSLKEDELRLEDIVLSEEESIFEKIKRS